MGKAKIGRPKTPNPKCQEVFVRLTPSKLAALDALVARNQEAVKGLGVRVSRSSLLRGLLDLEIDRAGISSPTDEG